MGRLGSLVLRLPSEVCSCPEAKVELLIWLDFCQYLGGRVVLSGDVPGSRAPATLEGVVAEGPPRESGTHDPRHHSDPGWSAVHVAHGFVSGSQN